MLEPISLTCLLPEAGTHFTMIELVLPAFASIITGADGSEEKQECIPVGCVPSSTGAVCWGVAPGGCLLWGVSALGVSAPGVCSRGEAVPALGGGVVSQHALRQTPLWTDTQM